MSAARQAWLTAQDDGATSAGSLLQGEVLQARTAWLESVDRGTSERETAILFQRYIAVVARAGVLTESRQAAGPPPEQRSRRKPAG